MHALSTGLTDLSSFRVRDALSYGMCLLLRPHPASAGAPYPPAGLRRSHQALLASTDMYRYTDCTGRMVRDCIVVSKAAKLLSMLQASSSSSSSE